MINFRFVLSPEGVAHVHEAVTCLSKFSEDIGWEASPEKLILSALNTSKTASASVHLYANEFFQSYKLIATGQRDQRDSSQGLCFKFFVLSKALFSVFKGRMPDARDRESSIESCEVKVQEDSERAECRLVIRLICRHGVLKTYRLTYEPGEIRHAIFRPEEAHNRWTINSSTLGTFSEYFGARTEHLDFYHDAGRFVITSYTEKVTNGSEVLKQPLQTSVNLDRLDFDEFSVEEKLHIGISVKDFRAIVAHAECLRASICVQYSRPSFPLRVAYSEKGMSCEFTLVTIGQYRGGSVIPTVATASNQRPNRPTMLPEAQRLSGLSSVSKSGYDTNSMPPPLLPASRSFTREPGSQVASRPSPPPPRASVNHDSLFVQDEDNREERQWGEKSFEEDQDELRWDPGDIAPRGSLRSGLTSHQQFLYEPGPDERSVDSGVPPTQRMSQVAGIFDD